jgi:hypothetical protein
MPLEIKDEYKIKWYSPQENGIVLENETTQPGCVPNPLALISPFKLQ